MGRLELNGQGFCTGTLIAPDLVLTAAHCVYDHNNNLRAAE
ncbi:trypsin-like serine peptidase [Phaeobacter sp. C3_T13_0]